MSPKRTMSIILLLALVAINCSEPAAPKKGITRYYITKFNMPEGWEDQFQYANDTLIEQTRVYKDGKLFNTQRPIWRGDHSFAIELRGYQDEIISTRKFTFAGETISSIMVHDFYPKYDYEYNFSLDSQSRLDSYVNSRVDYPRLLETGKATWQTDSLSVLQTAGTNSRVFGVKFEGGTASPWSGLAPEALATIMFQNMNIMECFVQGKISALGNSSYGYYKYDEYFYDSDNNLTSFRRTNTTTGKVEYFNFEWKKVLL